ncbi:hypothetical protein KQI85_05780 [Falcatimonas sp. MSJ-15]|uniref:hypothetical protein n=1 Tax=Falcatimonas sp. MSJ-15 TaxID=2841515 RepID=UPI001C0F8DE9|nr:hypothetical protein [Falcatimonas sp. MSJ-15]MBU5469875.1 hypothetical protein [Falcatimonas sp. MSJ-15]
MKKKKISKTIIINTILIVAIAAVIIPRIPKPAQGSTSDFEIIDRQPTVMESDDYISQPYWTRDGANICKASDGGYYIKENNVLYHYNSELTDKTEIMTDAEGVLGEYIYGYEDNIYAFQKSDRKVDVVSLSKDGIRVLFEAGYYEAEYFDKWKLVRQGDYIYVCNSRPEQKLSIYRYKTDGSGKECIAKFESDGGYFADMKGYGADVFYSVVGDATEDTRGMKIANVYRYDCDTGTTMRVIAYPFGYFTIHQKRNMLFGYYVINDEIASLDMKAVTNNADESDISPIGLEYDCGVESYVFSNANNLCAVIYKDNAKQIYVTHECASEPDLVQYIDIPEDEDVVFADDTYIFFSSGRVLRAEDLAKGTYNDSFMIR